MKKYFKDKKGFTLIELLVVVAIIGLLASVVLASLNTARAKGRDANRYSEMNSLQTALELYYNDYGQYPGAYAASSGVYASAWPTLLSSTYIGSMPLDPINTTGQYGYYYAYGFKKTGNCNSPWAYTGLITDYILATRLENPPAVANGCPSAWGGWDNSNLNYVLGD